VLREEGVPQDLIYLAQAEERVFKPLALFHGPGARGIWQFVQWRGNEYGLKRTWWVDERMDPRKKANAKRRAQHLRDLYGLFRGIGTWPSPRYNCGPGNVQKGVERTGYADFWELYKRKCAAAGDEELCADHPGSDFDRQGCGALWNFSGAGTAGWRRTR